MTIWLAVKHFLSEGSIAVLDRFISTEFSMFDNLNQRFYKEFVF